MWSVATILDRIGRYWMGDRSERQRLGWLEDTRDGLGPIYLPIQEYFAVLMASYIGAEYKPCWVLYSRSMHKSVRETLDDLIWSRFPSSISLQGSG